MLNSILSIFGLGKKVDYKELLHNGGVIVDVRSKGEYNSGHIKGSINIPLDQLSSNLKKFKKDQAIITCCASGMRSGAAKSLLKSKGFEHTVNGGSWYSLNAKI
jgi:rhodanese-related sulfurtransferase